MKMTKADKKYQAEAELFQRLHDHLDSGKSARSFPCTEEEREVVATCALLSNKPVIHAANMDETGFADFEHNSYYLQVKALADREGAEVLPVCAKLEEDIAALPEEERGEFLEELGITSSGLSRLVRASYHLLGLISYLTAGEPEVRAWTITRGTKAPQAAGKIHSDFERGFIRAEVIAYEDLMACGSLAAAKEKGLVRSEGKEYVMQDGDVVLVRFNV